MKTQYLKKFDGKFIRHFWVGICLSCFCHRFLLYEPLGGFSLCVAKSVKSRRLQRCCIILSIYVECLITPTYKDPRWQLSITKWFLREKDSWQRLSNFVSEFAILAQKWFKIALRIFFLVCWTILVSLLEELAEEGTWLWLLALVTCDR